MRKSHAAVGTALFLAVAPGVVAGLVPWLITGWQSGDTRWVWPVRVLGGALTAVSALVLLDAFRRFVSEGSGTPAPALPTEQLVVGGLYRYVRNPMYVAVVACIVGQSLWLSRPWLLLYAAAVWFTVAAFVRWYEEPTLSGRYGGQYDEYRRSVPAWLPRLPGRTGRRS